jgi:hypothetical protein
MDPTILLPIIAFLALAAGLAVVLRGTGRIVARTREIEQFRSTVRDLAARIDSSLGGAGAQIDAVRRHHVGPDGLSATIAAATDAVERYTAEAEALHGPSQALTIRADIVADLQRAHRALEMVEHGTTILATVRRGPRELEAQTSIKRGYLSLLHARQAISGHALAAERLETDGGRQNARSRGV